ncbi:DNA polymerase II large subunit [Halorubellus sp. JP-L1]|uniref:DNA polymerase II large subunit n=1 Tax=Halorubellus sp. JP-L1 TaxID=2715753 RepID=UPI00140AF56A|nr:DNA polymerase II large subunit [Halorubellus sp. JP-L1]NHN41710.1 DNA polymerase II large subunit [Halorubellus sp. JP-L1]
MREADERYFERLEANLDEAFDVAERAKRIGDDPKPEVEIPTARDMADRVENILGIDGVAERVRELEGEMSREEAALALVEDFVEGSVGDYDSREGKVEGAVRTAVALLTEGVVAAPIEGIDRVELLTNDDGTEFINIYYAGPIRSAGGTAQALSVLVADYARTLLDVDEFKARDEEVERYAEEVDLYDSETGLQYSPKDEETKFIAEHMPIMLDGEATGDEEVQGGRDLERVDTNAARGGMCLVLAEGIALKAPKIQRYTRTLDDVDWPWLQDLIDGTIGKDDGDDAESEAEAAASDGEDADANADDAEGADDAAPTGPLRPEKSKKYLRDLIAGRPVFGHPSESGGFRLRYGRARNHGFATAGVHPATMHLVDDFLATGTQIKTERPGKAAGVVPVDSIDGPTVRLANGDVRRIDDPAEAKEVRNGVESILDLGEYLVNYGEFVENNHPLAPASYTVEWWRQDLEAAGCDVQALQDSPRVDLADPDASTALDWASAYDAPLHPQYTYMFHDVSVDDFETLADAVADAAVEPAVADGGALARDDDRNDRKGGDQSSSADAAGEGADDDDREPIDPDAPGVLVLERTETTRRVLERLLVTHRQTDDELRVDDWVPLARSLGVEATRDPDADGPTVHLERTWTADDLSERAREYADGENAIEAANEVAPFELVERAPTRIGNRMGRPEKSESRDLSPAVHTLFPIGEAGGSQRSVGEAAKHAPDMQSTPGLVESDVGRRRCPACDTETWRARCPECDARTDPEYWCPFCEQDLEPDDAGRVHCDRCDADGTSVEPTEIDVDAVYHDAMRAVGERENAFEILKGVQGLMSANKTPEPMEKGILRAKHDVSSFKDGTVRYDMTDLPVTAVRPSELDATADQFKGLGYEEDVHGEPLRHDDQLVELKVQDVVLSNGAAEHMLKTAAFVDDLLDQYYGLDRFYEFDDRDDLIGELVFGMAPHTSAATVGRVVGFTSAAVGYAHPYFHAAKRRNCDGDEDCVMLLLDGLLNFSKSYLPNKRGGRMDAPLVMSSRIDPSEIDDEAHNMDVMWEYPREFYEATREMADPEDVEEIMTIAEENLGSDREYTDFFHTHDTSDLALGPDLSAYKTLGSMEEKMDAQLHLSRNLRAVDETDVAERIIEGHFLPDLIGNLRAFARQETRCLDCGEKYRRMPLTGECRECGGRVNLTVHEGSVNKYMQTAIDVADDFGCRTYTKQRLEKLERALESIFENDHNKQSGIADFM